MKTRHWILLTLWVFYLGFAGPFLWSARDWLLVTCAAVIPIGLIAWTAREFRYTGDTPNA